MIENLFWKINGRKNIELLYIINFNLKIYIDFLIRNLKLKILKKQIHLKVFKFYKYFKIVFDLKRKLIISSPLNKLVQIRQNF